MLIKQPLQRCSYQPRTEGLPTVPNCCPSCLQELKEQKEELLTKVQALKTDLKDWRTKLEVQVKNYKSVRGYLSSWWGCQGQGLVCWDLLTSSRSMSAVMQSCPQRSTQ
jgi:hypothetical protein